MRLVSAAKLFSFSQPAWVWRSVFDWFKRLKGKLKLISKILAGKYVEKMEQNSDMNLTLVPKSSFQAAKLCFKADADEINIDPSDDAS